MELINGNEIATAIVAELKEEVSQLNGESPCITFIRVGEDPASVSYVNKKNKIAAEIGMTPKLELLPPDVSKDDLFAKIDELNANASVHGILIQAPLPSHIDEVETFRRVLPQKDVDGFHTENIGKICQEDETGFVACTPAGIIELLSRSNVSLSGTTVTVCHSRTADLPSITRQADVLIAAIGRPEFVTKDMVKPGAVVIDVGINRIEDSSRKSGYRLTGDVNFKEVSPITSQITPVPGGVGPMTVAMLMKNTLKAFKLAQA
jgi:methylenetetrahydrofolate dehydrogenase (NADP+)/methenyltetrahydrofolate cyclohydrolase